MIPRTPNNLANRKKAPLRWKNKKGEHQSHKATRIKAYSQVVLRALLILQRLKDI